MAAQDHVAKSLVDTHGRISGTHTVQLHGYGLATFASDGKWDGLDEFFLQEWDAASEMLRVIGDAIVVER